MKDDAPFEYVFVGPADRKLFDQYVELRRWAYLREYPWLPADFGCEDAIDGVSQIVVALYRGAVAGGARLTISTPDFPRAMPLEEKGFSLKDCDFLNYLRLSSKPYGEISRMAIRPVSTHGFELSFGLGNTLCAQAAGEGLDVVFSICPEKPARLNRFNAKRRGVEFHKYFRLQTVFDVNMWLCSFTGLFGLYGSGQKTAA